MVSVLLGRFDVTQKDRTARPDVPPVRDAARPGRLFGVLVENGEGLGVGGELFAARRGVSKPCYNTRSSRRADLRFRRLSLGGQNLAAHRRRVDDVRLR